MKLLWNTTVECMPQNPVTYLLSINKYLIQFGKYFLSNNDKLFLTELFIGLLGLVNKCQKAF